MDVAQGWISASPAADSGPAFLGITLGQWIAIFVPIAALIGVVLSLWNARAVAKRQLDHAARDRQMQLDHDALQRDRERQMSIRREVYLEAAAALVRMQTTMGQLTDITIDAKEITATFGQSQAAIVKTHIVGTQETVDAVMRYTNAAGPAFLDMLSRRPSLQLRNAKIDTHTALLQKALEDQARFTRMLETHNLEGGRDSARVKAIQKQYEFASESYNDHYTKRAHFQAEQISEHRAVVDHMMDLNRNLVRLLPRAVLAVRAEMELRLDAEWYEAQWLEQIRFMDAAWAEINARLQTLVNQQC
jgi:hypothetical protein